MTILKTKGFYSVIVAADIGERARHFGNQRNCHIKRLRKALKHDRCRRERNSPN
ncbi:preprotein translocase subunit YajC, partial [Sesbania bispinosa]